MKYVKVKFTISPDSQTARDLIMAFAGDCGFESFTDDSEPLLGYCQVENYHEDELKNILTMIPLENTSINFETNEVEDKNWNEEWEKNGFKPIIIADKCIISCFNNEEETFENQDRKNLPIHIYIDAKQAFGTGTHETTQMIVGKLFDLDLSDKRVLDCGCGTGILSIVSAKLGAKEVISYDIDEWSVKNAMHNAAINAVSIDVLEGDKKVLSHVCGVFDIVLANINRNILLDDLECFTEILAVNGRIILSGFYEEDASLLMKKAATLNLSEIERQVNHNWCCLILQKNQ